MQKVTPFLMFNGRLEEAVNFYKAVFADAKIENLSSQSATFELGGQKLLAYDGGEHFKFTEAISLFIDCKDQEEVDYYWEALTADGGKESMCGWVEDKFGVSWQVIPRAMMEYLNSEDREASQRAVQAMLGMRKLIVKDLERAYAGE